MSRIAYTPADVDQPSDVVDALRSRQGGRLRNVDRMLLHSPALARGWNGLLDAMREGLELDPQLRELAICTVALLNQAHYEFAHHAPAFLAAGGSPAQLAALANVPAAVEDAVLFSPRERVTLAIAFEMTRRVKVNEAYFAAARAALPPQQVVELVGVIATANAVARFLVALDVDFETQLPTAMPDLASLRPAGHA